MVDTVRDNDHSAHPPEERNGYAFQDTDHEAIESGLGRALRLWFDQPAGFRHLIRRAMGTDHSWKRPGEEYAKIYEYIRHR